jgi:hypothetical protein
LKRLQRNVAINQAGPNTSGSRASSGGKGRSDELAVQNAIRLAAGRGSNRLFRNNTGALKDQAGRLVRYGLCKGSSDLIGWRSLTITPDMVGQQVAVFAAIEVKDRGTPTAEQLHFIAQVQAAGGLAGVARTVAEAEAILGM